MNNDRDVTFSSSDIEKEYQKLQITYEELKYSYDKLKKLHELACDYAKLKEMNRELMNRHKNLLMSVGEWHD